MLDIKLLREKLDVVIANLNKRGGDFSYLKTVIDKDTERRKKLVTVEEYKNKRNTLSKEIGVLKREKKDATSVLNEVSKLGSEIERLDKEVKELDEYIKSELLKTPNMLHESVPFGKDETENKVLKAQKPTKFSFPVKAHYELGEELGILDFERAAKISGARFCIYKGLGARLERALINFFMDENYKAGYTEVMPPYIVNKDSMYGTGQLPKFEDAAFKLASENEWYLNPTAEVPTINMFRGETVDYSKLPMSFTSYTTAFRSEAGSAGKDTRGLIRMHQFNKVELIKLSKKEDSYKELDKMIEQSCSLLEKLKLPYRLVSLCSGDMGFGMAKTIDIEVWLPSQNTYREIASISNAEDYQARRANITTRPNSEAKLEYVHTLNGSGLPAGRTVVAIMENYQQEDGSIKIPEVLVPYMLGVKEIRKENK